MARRGRFTSPNSGGQNLTALITNLLRERNSAEEQALLNAYRTGTAYNGVVPNAADIQAFYDNWAATAGYSAGSLEYQSIFQKKSDLNNYDLKKQYNGLISDFNATNGANYQDIINFVTGAAQTSTDPNDLADYASAVESTTSAYLKYQGQRLVRGELTAAEYQRITLEAINVLDPSTAAYTNAVYDAYQYEWNAESSKWSNRIKAGTATNSQFRSWTESFQKKILSSGIDPASDLYGAIGATVAQTSMAVGDSPANARLSTTLTDLNTVFSIADAVVGGAKLSFSDINGDPKNVLKKLNDNPALVGLLADAINSDPSLLTPSLSALGITDGTSLLSWYDKTISSGLTDAAVITSAGGNANYDDWTAVATSSGSLTAFDEYAVGASKRARLIEQAAGDPSLITYYNNEYAKFLTGSDSFFGKAPQYDPVNKLNGLSDQQAVVIQNEYNALTGNPDGSRTISGYVGGKEPVWGDVQGYAADSADVSSGSAVLAWHPEIGTKGEFVAEDPRATGPKEGTYQYIAFTVLPDGTKSSHVVSVKGEKVVSQDGKSDLGWLFKGPSGNIYVNSTDGTAYTVTRPLQVRAEGYVITDPKLVGNELTDGVPLINLTPFSGAGSLSSINPNALSTGVTSENLRAAAASAAKVVAALDPDSQSKIDAAIQGLGKSANEQDAVAIASIPTADNLYRAAKLRGNSAATDYENNVLKNPGMYREVKPGLFYKENTNTGNFINDLIFNLDIVGNIANPTTIDLRTPEMIAADNKPANDQRGTDLYNATMNPLTDNNLLASFFGNLFKDKILGPDKVKTPMIPSITKPVIAPNSPTVYIPDIKAPENSVPTSPVTPPPVLPSKPTQILPPSRGGIRAL